MNKIDRIIKEKRAYSLEGTTGVKKLCGVIAAATGTTDHMCFGQHEHGSYGVLINFLEDNPGACEAIMQFIRDNFDEEHEEDEEAEEEDLDTDDCFDCRSYPDNQQPETD